MPGAQAVRPFKLRKSLGRGGGGGCEALRGCGGLRARVTLLLSPAQPPGWKKSQESGRSSQQKSR